MEEAPHPDVEIEEPRLQQGPPTPIYTYILVGCIVAVFTAQLLFGDAWSTISLTNLAADERSAVAAGFVKQYFTGYHEYWRILTGTAVHGGLLHVVMNCYAFMMFGRIVEMLSNRAHLAIVFLLSCLGGGLLSLYFLPDIPSVGASGGIVGLLGYVTIYAFRRRKFISPQFRKSLLINIGFLFLFGLVLFNVVDNYGHLGGLITGGIYGLIQIPSDEYKDPREASGIVRALGMTALGIFIATCVLSIVLIFNYRNAKLPISLDAPSSSSSTR